MSSIDFESDGPEGERPKIRRLNRLPIFIFIAIIVVLITVIVWAMANRGLIGKRGPEPDDAGGAPATDFADELTRNIGDGVNEPPRAEPQIIRQANNDAEQPEGVNPFQRRERPNRENVQQRPVESEADWRERLEREQEEALIRERNRQQLAALQAQRNARSSPMAVDVSKVAQQSNSSAQPGNTVTRNNGTLNNGGMADLYAAAMKAQGTEADPNGQPGKVSFLNQEITDAGYLPNQVVPQQSPYELKRGSTIPATLISGINSDLPGRITAQVRQNVYDSATGHRLLIPQGTKLFGRYDSQVSYGQSRVLVVWTDIIFPNGSTLQIGGMAGVDSEGYGGFHDKVNNHFWRVWGSALLVAAIGTAVDVTVPSSNVEDDANSAARRNFAETFGRVAERTIDKNMNVQPTLEIRPGYNFNVLVDQDIVFPGAYQTGYVER